MSRPSSAPVRRCRFATGLAMMLAVAVVLGRRRRRPGDPVRRGRRASAPATSPRTHGRAARRARDRKPAPAHADPRRQRASRSPPSTTRTASIVPLRQGLAHDGQGDRRHRGLPLLPARRAGPQGHAARPGDQPGQQRRRAGRVLDHPAAGQADPASDQAQHRGGAGGRHRRHLRPQAQRAALRRSRWSRSTPRTGSSSATSTPPTSATAPTASRPRRATTSTSTPRTSTSPVGAAGRPGARTRRATTPPTPPTGRCERRNIVLDRMAAARRDQPGQGRQGRAPPTSG